MWRITYGGGGYQQGRRRTRATARRAVGSARSKFREAHQSEFGFGRFVDGYLWLGVSPGLWVRIAGKPPRVNRQPCIFYSIVYFMVYFMVCAPELCQPLTCGAPFRGRASAADEREASARERRCAVILKNALALFFSVMGGGRTSADDDLEASARAPSMAVAPQPAIGVLRAQSAAEPARSGGAYLCVCVCLCVCPFRVWASGGPAFTRCGCIGASACCARSLPPACAIGPGRWLRGRVRARARVKASARAMVSSCVRHHPVAIIP